MQFCFGDIVVVEENLIGVICKSWIRNNKELYYDVYVRDYSTIKQYDEKDIQRYMVRHKELSEEEMEYQKEAMKSFVTKEDVMEFLSKLNLDNL